MKTIVSIIMLFIINTNYYSQSLDSDKKHSIQAGVFICRMNNCLIYSYTEDDGEYPLYTLYSLNLNTGNKEIIESQLTVNNWVKVSDSTLCYIKSDKLLLWNLNTKMKFIFIDSGKFSDIIGIGFNPKNKFILLAEADYNNSKVRISIIDELKNTTFNYKVEFNEMEVEGISPKIESIANYFVIMVQYKLYVVDLTNTKPNMTLISDDCADFALNDTVGVLYYKYITTDGKTEGYFSQFENRRTIKITNLLKEKISICANSTLFTANIGNKLIPVYLICGTPFVFSELKWHLTPDAVIYKDDKLSVQYPISKQKRYDLSFEWNWQGF